MWNAFTFLNKEKRYEPIATEPTPGLIFVFLQE